jgi:hypothetical protein
METSDTLPYPNVSAALSVNDKCPAQGEQIFSLCPQNAPILEWHCDCCSKRPLTVLGIKALNFIFYGKGEFER